MEASKRMSVTAMVAAVPSMPIVWLVSVGAVICMWLRPATRARGCAQFAKWGGWRNLPVSAGRSAWRFLSDQPYAVLIVAGFVSLVSMLIGFGTRYLTLSLSVAVITAMVIPTFEDEITRCFGERNSRRR
ncbi:MAG TPA: hypothetical protein VFR90_06820 [Methylibium sp.]|uniref:hypothetical protein n=1 Tax=Methylibium sp. TaxID=2067992 RepID=UPI002DB89846|nr:hypothetical protein [Methylibium sp.]HEU4458818.1 hypothetical protein [Methylibium sp.]